MKPRKTKKGPPAEAGQLVKGKTRILVVDDHPIVCQALAALIDRQTDLQCCATANTLDEARQKIATEQAELVLLDLRLGSGDGFESIRNLKKDFPQLRILIISNFDENVYAEPALRAGR
jgi:DNA-binding NarL/FixJ family response regulator